MSDLEKRVELLEKRVAELEGRVQNRSTKTEVQQVIKKISKIFFIDSTLKFILIIVILTLIYPVVIHH